MRFPSKNGLVGFADISIPQYIIIDSVLGFQPTDSNRYTQAAPGKMAMMRHEFEDVSVIFCDEISMVGSMKLLKINFRLQDLVEESRSHDFMGGVSFVASGIDFDF